MSVRSPSSSSSASRKTWLSSTRRTRIGSLTLSRLLSGDEERVVQLTALVHVQLERGVPLGELVDQAVQRRRALAAQEREYVAWLGQQPFEQLPRDVVEVRARGDRPPVEQRQELTLAHRDAVGRSVARGNRDLPGDDAGQRFAHRRGVLLGRALVVEGDQRCEAGGDRARRDDLNGLARDA